MDMLPRTCVVVAHPDDETLFAGGMAARLKCDIICCSIPKRDPVRALKFYDACEVLGCRGIVIPMPENPPELLDLKLLDLKRYSTIITHNQIGEYGHPHHIQIHDHVRARYRDKKVILFGYGVDGRSADIIDDEYSKKLEAIKKYNHTTEIDKKPKWEALIDRYCPNGLSDLRRETYVGI